MSARLTLDAAFTSQARAAVALQREGYDLTSLAFLAADKPGRIVPDARVGSWLDGVCFLVLRRSEVAEDDRKAGGETSWGRWVRSTPSHRVPFMVRVGAEEIALALPPEELERLDADRRGKHEGELS